MKNLPRNLLILICLSGTALFAQPEMDLLRASVSIADEGSDVISNTGSSPFNLSYTIQNDGSSDLTISGVTVSAENNCSVLILVNPGSPVTAAGMTTLTLQVSPVSATGFSFDLSIDNNDSDENPYNITFSGNGGTASSSSGSSSGDSDCSTHESSGSWMLVWLSAIAFAAIFRLRNSRKDARHAND